MKFNLTLLLLLCTITSQLMAQGGPVQAPLEVEPIRFVGAANTHTDPMSGKVVPFKDPKTGSFFAAHWAFDAKKSILGGVFPGENVLKTFHRVMKERNGELTSQVLTSKNPTQVFHKVVGDQSFFVVICEKASIIEAYDSQTLKFLARLKLRNRILNDLVEDTPAEHPYIAFWAHSKVHAIHLMRIDFRKVAEGKITFQESEPVERARYATLSKDASHVYYRTSRSDGEYLCYSRILTNAKGGLDLPIVERRRSYGHGKPFLHHFGGFVLTTEGLFAPQLKGELITPAGKGRDSLGSFTHGKPLYGRALTVVQSPGHIGFVRIGESSSDAYALTVKPIPSEALDPRDLNSAARRPRYLTMLNYVFHDEANERMITCYGSHVVVVDLKATKVPSPPLYAFTLEGPNEVQAGEVGEWNISNYGSEGTFKLREPIAGLKIQGTKITFSPASTDPEIFRLKVEFTSGKMKFHGEKHFIIARPFFGLPKDMMSYKLSPNGRYLLASDRGGRNHRSHNAEEGTSLSVYDLVTGKEIASRDLLTRINKLTLSDSHVALHSVGTETVVVYKLTDFTEIASLSFKHNLSELDFVGDKHLIVGAHNRRVYGSPDFKRLKSGPLYDLFNASGDSESPSYQSRHMKPVWFPNGFGFDGDTYGFDGKRLPATLIPRWASEFTRTKGGKFGPGKVVFSHDLRTHFVNMRSWGASGQIKAAPTLEGFRPLTSSRGQILNGAPVIASIGWATKNFSARSGGAKAKSGGSQARDDIPRYLSIAYWSLQNKRLIRTQTLMVDSGRFRRADLHDIGGSSIIEHKDKLILVFSRRVFVLPMPTFSATEAPVPLHSKMNEGMPFLASDDKSKRMRVKYEMAGDSEGLVVTSMSLTSGLSFSGESSTLVVSASKARKVAMEYFNLMIGSTNSLREYGVRVEEFEKSDDILAAIKKHQESTLGRTLGLKPSEIGIPFSFRVSIENDAGESVTRAGSVFVGISDKDAKRAIEKVWPNGLAKKRAMLRELQKKIKEMQRKEAKLLREIESKGRRR